MYRSLILLILIGTAFRPAFAPRAGGVAGTWKRTTMALVESNGKTTDMMQMMTRSMPCTKDVTYTFMSDGKMKTNVPDACGSMKKTIESMSVDAHWSMSGRKITVTTSMKEFPAAVYDVSMQGSTMTWVFTYADNPKSPNPTKAQRLTTVYERI
jgi:hypothetical protein